jgi:hypothetical protein
VGFVYRRGGTKKISDNKHVVGETTLPSIWKQNLVSEKSGHNNLCPYKSRKQNSVSLQKWKQKSVSPKKRKQKAVSGKIETIINYLCPFKSGNKKPCLGSMDKVAVTLAAVVIINYLINYHNFYFVQKG